jgi:hypothetical protein
MERIIMATFQIVRHKKGRQIGPELHDLPALYMEDFSRLGFSVSDCEATCRVLEQNAFRLNWDGKNATVRLEGISQVAAVVQLLAESDINCDIADVADGIYQG